MRSKIISLLLAFMMIFTLIPATAFAETTGSDLIEVTVNVAPSTANVTFYAGDDATTPLPAEQVTDNGIVEKYHQYVLKVEKGRYSYRGVDTLDTEDTSDDRALGGMAFNVPLNDEIMEDGSASGEGQTLALRLVNFYTTNTDVTEPGDYTLKLYPSYLPQAVNGDQYLGTIGTNAAQRVITPMLIMARGNALTYHGNFILKDTLAEEYGVTNIVNYTQAAGTTVVNKSFSLTALKLYSITAPADAKTQVFSQINNFNVEEINQTNQVENEDGTITHNFKLIGSGLTYRVSKEGKVTRAGFFTTKDEQVVVNYEENENPEATGHALDNANIQKRMEASTLVNVNGQNNLKLATGDTFRLRAYRGAWQIVNSDTANIMIEPDFNYEVISGGEHIEMTPATNKCTGNAGTGDATNWMDIKGISAGTAIIEVSYDAIQIGGDGTSYDGFYGATDPQRKSLVVINVGAGSGNLAMKAIGSSSNWDTEYDTLYFVGEKGALNFTATMDGDVPDKVELSTDKGKTWSAVNSAEGVFKAEGMVGGNNIIRFTKGDVVEYQVVRAAAVTYTLTNLTRDSEEIIAGDQVKIVFDGLYTPISKFSGIYNPGFGQGHKVAYALPDGVTAVAAGGQYDFITTNSYTVTTGAAGDLALTGGHVEFNCMGVDDPLGGHRTLTDEGCGSNFSAVSTMHARGVLPDITLEVIEMPEIPVTVDCDTENTDIVITDEEGQNVTEENGVYKLPYGEFAYVASKDGYVTERGTFTVTKADYLKGKKTVSIKMRKIEGPIWDGSTTTEPLKDENGVYQIGTGAELAWFAANAGNTSYNAVLTDDISLGGFEWTPIAKSAAWKGTFDGQGHYVTDLYINSTANNVALFGYVGTDAVIKNLGVKGEVTTTGNYAAGIATVKTATISFTIENCVSDVNVTAAQHAGGIIAYQSTKQTVINCYNTGSITGTKANTGTYAGGISTASSTSQKVTIENCYNAGAVKAGTEEKQGKAGTIVYITATNAVNVKNCYGVLIGKMTATAGKSVSKNELKGMAATLGEAYIANPTSYNDGYPILKWEEPRALPIAQEDAIVEIETYKNADDYRATQQNELAAAIEECKKAVEEATTLTEVTAAVAEAKATIDTLKTDAEYTAEELEAAKLTAKATVESYKNPADYRTEETDALAKIKKEAVAAIEIATVITEIQPIVDKAKADMDALKTDAQLTAEELAAAKAAAIEEVEAYKNADDYRTLQKIELELAINSAKKDINNVQSIPEIQPIVDAAKAEMDMIKTDAQLTAEEELAAAKTAGIKEVKRYKNAEAYRETEQKELAAVIEEATAAIEAAENIDAVDAAVETAKSKMDKIKTDDQLTAEESLSAAERAQLAAEEARAEAEAARAEAEAAQKAAEEAQEKADAAKEEAEILAGQAAVDREAAEKAKAEAETAKAEAEAAQAAAEEAQKAAEEALAKAEEAGAQLKAEAEAAQKAAEEAQAKAEAAEKAAEAAKADAEKTKEEVEALAKQAAADKEAAEAAKAEAEALKQSSDENLAAVKELKTEIEQLVEKAAADKEAAETAKSEAEALAKQAAEDRAAAEAAQEAAETAKADAEKAKAEAEAAQAAAEKAKKDANATKDEVEMLKAEAEVKAAEAEAAQAAAEEAQAAAEKAKAEAEVAQAKAEAAQAATEADRAAAEEALAKAEATLADANATLAEAEIIKTELEAALKEVQAKLDQLNEVVKLAAPTNVKATNIAKSGKIKVTWKKVKGADEYIVYRAKSKNGAYRKMFTTTGTQYTNTYAKAGTTYFYKVKAIADDKNVENSSFSKIVKRTCDLKRPVVTVKSTAKKQVKLSWKKVKGADKYVVYRATSKNGTYKKMFTTKKLKLTNLSLKSGKTYYYKVKAIKTNKTAANSAFSIVKKVKCK